MFRVVDWRRFSTWDVSPPSWVIRKARHSSCLEPEEHGKNKNFTSREFQTLVNAEVPCSSVSPVRGFVFVPVNVRWKRQLTTIHEFSRTFSVRFDESDIWDCKMYEHGGTLGFLAEETFLRNFVDPFLNFVGHSASSERQNDLKRSGCVCFKTIF